MAVNSTQPENQNFLSPLGFRFSIKKTPNINWFVQSINLPGLSLPSAVIETPFKRIPLSGEKMEFDPFTIQFKVDEDLRNYIEMYTWLVGTAFPDNFDQYFGRSPNQTTASTYANNDNIKSDANLIILNSKMNPILDITFIDVAPIELGELRFDIAASDIEYIQVSATFSYRYFTLKQLY
jgi:hypothetical protein